MTHTIDAPSENWTRFPNSILDNLHLFSGLELKVLACLCRANKGLTFSEINEKTGIDPHEIGGLMFHLHEKGFSTLAPLSDDGEPGFVLVAGK